MLNAVNVVNVVKVHLIQYENTHNAQSTISLYYQRGPQSHLAEAKVEQCHPPMGGDRGGDMGDRRG